LKTNEHNTTNTLHYNTIQYLFNAI
jgi:hypothetical protein